MLMTATLSRTGPVRTAAKVPSLRGIAFQAAAIIAAFAVPTAVALLLDPRQLNDVSVWDKPLKFEASLGLHLITLGLLASLLAPHAAARAGVRLAYQISAAASVAELSYIVLQAARGRASHFNYETGIELIMYGIMGAGAVLLVLSSFAIGYAILNGAKPETGRGLRLGAAWGLMLGSAATLITAGVMSSGMIGGPGHWAGGVHSDANGFPLTGWSRTGGDLRVPHFLATHMMQALPLLGLIAGRAAKYRAPIIVGIGAIGMLAAVALTLLQAISGHPLLPL